MKQTESKISLSAPLAFMCVAGYGIHSVMDEFNTYNTVLPEPPARVNLEGNPLGKSTLPELPSATEELKSDINKVEEKLDKQAVSELSSTPFTDEQLHQISEYIERERKSSLLKLMKSSVSICSNTPLRKVSHGAGTVIRHPSGESYIITAAHLFRDGIVASLDDVKITDYHGNSLKLIKVISCDIYDVAVVKVSGIGDAVPVEKIGEIHFGDEVLGFGKPYGFESIYSGIVSSSKKGYISRVANGDAYLIEVDDIVDEFRMEQIQYSAPVESGHSGGPLFNRNGEFMGFASAVKHESKSISFFTPAELAVSVANQLFSYEKYCTPDLDIEVQDLDDVQKEKLPSFYGEDYLREKCPFMPVLSVLSVGNDARKAGLREGDIILKINDELVSSRADYYRALHCAQPGEKVKLDLFRGNTFLMLELTAISGQPIQTKVID